MDGREQSDPRAGGGSRSDRAAAMADGRRHDRRRGRGAGRRGWRSTPTTSAASSPAPTDPRPASGSSPRPPTCRRASSASWRPTDEGRYVLPDLPDASYEVFVRGYGLVDSTRVEAAPGQALESRRRRGSRRSGRGGGLSGGLVAVHDGAAGGRAVAAGARERCHRLPQLPPDRQQGDARRSRRVDPERRRLARRGLGPARRDGADGLGDGTACSAASASSGRCSPTGRTASQPARRPAQNAPPAAGSGAQRSGDAVGLGHGVRRADRQHARPTCATARSTPTASSTASCSRATSSPSIDPVEHRASTIPIPSGAPRILTDTPTSPYYGDDPIWARSSDPRSVAMDGDGRVWLTGRIRGPDQQPSFCTDAANAFAGLLPARGRHAAGVPVRPGDRGVQRDRHLLLVRPQPARPRRALLLRVPGRRRLGRHGALGTRRATPRPPKAGARPSSTPTATASSRRAGRSRTSRSTRRATTASPTAATRRR